MPEASLVAMGVAAQWGTSLLLFLFFFRLGRHAAHRDAVRTWTWAWGVAAVAASGSMVRTVATLTGDPTIGGAAARRLDLLAIPGTLLFATLAAIGALQAAGRPIPVAIARRAVVAMGVLGVAIALVNDPVVTGVALVITTVTVYFGLAIAVVAAERRDRPHRFPLLAAAMFLTGAVTLVYQLGSYFGQVVWPIDDFVATVGWSAGYAGALMSLILAGTLVTLIMDDAFRGTVATHVLDGREPIAPETASSAVVVSAVEETPETNVPEPVTAPSPAVAIELPPVARDEPVRVRMPRARTATLPRPPVHPDGNLAEVLLVSDEAAARSTLARIFQRGGWPVRDVSTGEEALAWLLDVPAEDAPAIILCDFKMPGMGGREVHEHLVRERPELVSRIVFVTGDASRESARAFVLSTSSPLVEKPFMVSEIARAVEQVLAAPHAAG